MNLSRRATHQSENGERPGRASKAPGKCAGDEEKQNAEQAGDPMERKECVRSRGFVPEVGGENVKKSRRRQNNGREFLLPLYVLFSEVRIARDAVVDQVGDVVPVK